MPKDTARSRAATSPPRRRSFTNGPKASDTANAAGVATPSKDGKKTPGKRADGTFAPGNTHGKGRPAGSRNRASLAMEALLDGQAEALTQKAIDLALEGDATALRLCLERLCPPRKSRPVQIELPDATASAGVAAAQAAVVQAVATGDLTPDEGTALAGMLEARRRAIETVDIENRLTALEKERTK
jgi:hypothetical protein